MTKTITKADIADALYNGLGFSHAESLKLVDCVFRTMVDALAAGDSLKIAGFASFIPHHKVQRMGRNPRTGEKHPIAPRTVLLFKPSHLLKKALTEEGDE